MRFAEMGLKSDRRSLLGVFCVGLLAGILAINIGKSILLGDTGLFDEETLYQMKYMTVDSSALFCYVLRKRIGRMMILAVLSTTYLGYAACLGTAFWYGMSVGTFLTALAVRYGIKGILLALVSVFPQYIIYVPVMLAMLSWCESIFRRIYSRNGSYEAPDKGFWIGKAGQLAAGMAAAAAGCLLEGYVNPVLLLGFLKIF